MGAPRSEHWPGPRLTSFSTVGQQARVLQDISNLAQSEEDEDREDDLLLDPHGGSMRQSAEQPSPSVAFPSSHSSGTVASVQVPPAQSDAQFAAVSSRSASQKPLPQSDPSEAHEDSLEDALEEELRDEEELLEDDREEALLLRSTLHVAEHPSPLVVLPSSHSSAGMM